MENRRPGFPVSQAVLDIHRERAGQILKGFDHLHDDQHRDGSLTICAMKIILTTEAFDDTGWTRNRAAHVTSKWDYRQQMVIAAALIVAEIERIDRLNVKNNQSQSQQAK